MIETLMMAASLAVLGYAFYISSRLFWASRKDRGGWKWVYVAVSAFIFATYAIFALVLFSFVAALFTDFYFPDMLNIVLGVLLLSGAALIGAMMKYHLSVAIRQPEKDVRVVVRRQAGRQSDRKGETARLRKEISDLKKELEAANMMNRLAVGRELRIIELKKKIEAMQGGKGAPSS